MMIKILLADDHVLFRAGMRRILEEHPDFFNSGGSRTGRAWKKLLVVDDQYILKGLITVKHIQKKLKYPKRGEGLAGQDARRGGDRGRWRLFGTGAGVRREEVDDLAIDTAHHTARYCANNA